MDPEPDLDESTVAADPFEQFGAWFAAAADAAAMTLATATPTGRPSARVVLLRGFDARGFVFFTNYESRKAGDLDANPHAALVFHWAPLDRQVRIEGTVARIGAAESDAYFAGRPRGHQVGAWASPQSRPIPGRADLEGRLAAVESSFAADATVPRPPFWGGYRVAPEVFEFWRNRTDRLHDRVRYSRDAVGWTIDRLAP
jgi:pyridoxamine 5'-phosphate oxidase